MKVTEFPTSTQEDWQSLIESRLVALDQFLQASDWYGRENELVNLFAHSFLAKEPIHAAQIGIEVAVKQLPSDAGKKLVRKDLVLWSRPNETLWIGGQPVNDPVAVVEFKVNDQRECDDDIAWLKGFTSLYPAVLGYSVCGFVARRRGVRFVRVTNGVAHLDV